MNFLRFKKMQVFSPGNFVREEKKKKIMKITKLFQNIENLTQDYQKINKKEEKCALCIFKGLETGSASC